MQLLQAFVSRLPGLARLGHEEPERIVALFFGSKHSADLCLLFLFAKPPEENFKPLSTRHLHQRQIDHFAPTHNHPPPSSTYLPLLCTVPSMESSMHQSLQRSSQERCNLPSGSLTLDSPTHVARWKRIIRKEQKHSSSLFFIRLAVSSVQNTSISWLRGCQLNCMSEIQTYQSD